MADVLPLELPGSRSISGSPLVDAARKLTRELPDDLDAADMVLVVMVEQLAATIDGAARYGKASAAAMAARELREAIAHLQERHAVGAADAEQDFVSFADFLSGEIDRSGGAA